MRMALNISGKIAGFVFTVVVPLVVAAMIPHISVGAGIPIIAVSIVIGLVDWAWSFSPLPWRKKVFPILGLAAGLLVAAGFGTQLILRSMKESEQTSSGPKEKVGLPLTPVFVPLIYQFDFPTGSTIHGIKWKDDILG
jgi:hypothetical protein